MNISLKSIEISLMRQSKDKVYPVFNGILIRATTAFFSMCVKYTKKHVGWIRHINKKEVPLTRIGKYIW
jgi:hypothetical protein